MISEAELIDIETYASDLDDITGDVLMVLATAFEADIDYREGLDRVQAKVDRCQEHIARLVEEVRTANATKLAGPHPR